MQQWGDPGTFQRYQNHKNPLMAPKDRDSKLQESEVIYKFKCPHISCPEEYIGESGRMFGDRLKEHLRTPSPLHHHSNSTGHPVSPECFTIVDRWPKGVTRNIKEAMYIQVNDPSLNRNLWKHQNGPRFCKTHQLSNSNNPNFTFPLHGLIHPPTIILGHTQLHW